MKQSNVPFRIDHETASRLLGLDTEAVLNADPREFPARKSHDKQPEYIRYADIIPGIHECVDAFNSSFDAQEIVYFIASERWPRYFPVSACKEPHKLFRDNVICNAPHKAKIGRPMQIEDVVFTVRNSFAYSEHGLILFGVMYHELSTLKVRSSKVILDPIKHVLRTIGAPSMAEQYLIDVLIRLHWEKWQNKCPNFINGYGHDGEGLDIPQTILLCEGDKYGIEYHLIFGRHPANSDTRQTITLGHT